MIEFVRDCKLNKPENYEFSKVADFEITIYSTVVFAVLEYFITKMAYILFVPYCKEQNDEKLREIRSAKAASCIYNGIYYTINTIWAFNIMKNEVWYPTYLGGSGNYDLIFAEWPYPNHPPQLKEYFLMALGYHLSALVHHFYSCTSKDFIEMGLHHMVAVCLYVFMYLANGY